MYACGTHISDRLRAVSIAAQASQFMKTHPKPLVAAGPWHNLVAEWAPFTPFWDMMNPKIFFAREVFTLCRLMNSASKPKLLALRLTLAC